MNSFAVLVLVVVAHLSYYDPHICTLGDTWDFTRNCGDPANPYRMAGGHDARAWYGRALACPMEFGYGSHWSLPAVRGDVATPAREWVCLDRGGAIVSSVDADGNIHVALDLLLPYRIVGSTVLVTYRGPVAYALLKRVQRASETCVDKVMC